MLDILLNNFITIFLLIGFIILLRTGDVFDKKTEKFLGLAALVITLLLICDMVDYYLSSSSTLNKFRYVTSSLGYALRPTALGLFITILLRKKDSLLHVWIPIAIESMISFTSYWTHWMYYFTDANEFVRGPLGLLPHAMAFIYMAMLLYYAIKRFRITDVGEIITIFYIVIVCFAAVIVETVFGVKFLLPGGMLSSCIVYYTYLYVQVYKSDPLTKVYNRTTFDKDVVKRLSKTIQIIYVDLDNLKYINDTKGHLAGDRALRTVTDVLKKISDNKYRIYRVGGDEFYALSVNTNSAESQTYIDKAKRELAKNGLTASFGYASYKPGDDFAKCCIEADRKMYANKENKPVYEK